MPRGASFLYDVTQGGAEVHFAYDIRAKQDGKIIFKNCFERNIDPITTVAMHECKMYTGA